MLLPLSFYCLLYNFNFYSSSPGFYFFLSTSSESSRWRHTARRHCEQLHTHHTSAYHHIACVSHLSRSRKRNRALRRCHTLRRCHDLLDFVQCGQFGTPESAGLAYWPGLHRSVGVALSRQLCSACQARLQQIRRKLWLFQWFGSRFYGFSC